MTMSSMYLMVVAVVERCLLYRGANIWNYLVSELGGCNEEVTWLTIEGSS